jgi:predicted Zn-dependent protease with MMP-like domain
MNRICNLLLLTSIILTSGCASLFEKESIDPSDASVENSISRLNLTLLEAPAIYVEVDYFTDCEPSTDALEHLREKLLKYCQTSDVIIKIDDHITSSWVDSRTTWQNTLDIYRDYYGPKRLLRILYVPTMQGGFTYGFFTINRGIPTITVLKDSVRESATAMITTAKVEATLLVHEVAHGFGVPARRNHDDGTRHCTRPDCALYKPIDWRAIMTNWWRVLFFWEIPNELCALCEEEIFARYNTN